MDIRPTAGPAPQAPASAPEKASRQAPIGGFIVPAPAPTQASTAARPAGDSPPIEQVSDAIKSINEAMKAQSLDLELSFDIEDGRTIVKVTDKSTNEVIRQMPSEEALEIAKSLDRLQSLLIKQTA